MLKAKTDLSLQLAIFRADASPVIGVGHLMRCKTLADELADRGWRCVFALSKKLNVEKPAFMEFFHDVVELDAHGAEQVDEIKAINPDGCDLLVVDHYDLDWQFEGALQGWAGKTLVIDDLADRRHNCDWLLDQTYGRRPVDYEKLVAGKTSLIVGSAYALVRPQFFQARLDRIVRKGSLSAMSRIFVGFGATDPTNTTEKTLKALANVEAEWNIDVALTSTAPHLKRIQSLVDNLKMSVELHLDDENPAKFLAHCDLAIGAGGSTTWERCCLGLPSVIIVTSENQKYVARQLSDSGAAINLGFDADVSEPCILSAVSELLASPEKLRMMSQKSANLCDGLGVRRMAQLLDDRDPVSEGKVSLRPAEMIDAETIFEWQLAPETRRYARNPAVPSWDEHSRWMRAKLDDSACLFNMVVHNGESAGVVRLEPCDPDDGSVTTFEISIFTAPDKYQLGIASRALSLIRDLVPSVQLAAHVHRDNQVSANLFRKAGYRSDGNWFYSEALH